MAVKPHPGVRKVGRVVHYVRANGRSVLAQIDTLRVGNNVDLEVLPSRVEGFNNVSLLAVSSDTNVWYKSSRRHL